MATTEQDLQTTKATLPPGPGKLPYLGNMLSLRRDPLGYLQRLQRTYGNMATIYLGRTPVVLLFRPEHVRYVLVENPGNFSNRATLQENEGAASEAFLTINAENNPQHPLALHPPFPH